MRAVNRLRFLFNFHLFCSAHESAGNPTKELMQSAFRIGLMITWGEIVQSFWKLFESIGASNAKLPNEAASFSQIKANRAWALSGLGNQRSRCMCLLHLQCINATRSVKTKQYFIIAFIIQSTLRAAPRTQPRFDVIAWNMKNYNDIVIGVKHAKKRRKLQRFMLPSVFIPSQLLSERKLNLSTVRKLYFRWGESRERGKCIKKVFECMLQDICDNYFRAKWFLPVKAREWKGGGTNWS